MTLEELIANARFLLGDSPADNPEYTRGIVELLSDLVPGDSEESEATIRNLLGIEVSA